MMFEMDELVQDDIIDDFEGCHGKAVGEVQVVLA